MARTSLRDYTREIENLIENGQNEEAVAHCRHILQDYPKNLNANRLLGKAYLELGQDQEAASAFKQVLDAVPDDFIAHLGLSVMREHEGDLDASIRHMERAFDVQPANAVIQGELRRLYKERDGLEPQKIHLTRGALARMYAKGDLYSQAIAELRSALGEDPQRPDLQIVLAKMYAQSGQLLEAAETCNSLLNKFPDCLEAHYILGDILSRTERSMEAQAHYQRAAVLDPYAAHISPGQADSESVPDESVMLDRLEYMPAGPAAGVEPADQEWAEEVVASPVIEEGPLEHVEEVELEEETSEPGLPPVEPQEARETPAEEIPDWMKSAGWEPATGAGEEPPLEVEGETEEIAEEEELVKAEIPDWLKPLAPSEAEETALMEAESIEAAEVPAPWSGESSAAEEQETEPPLETGPEGELPDWMKAAEETQPEPVAETLDWPRAAEGEQLETEGEPPGWPESSEEEPAGIEGETPDWLKAAEEIQPEPGEETPDWLRASETEQPEPEAELPDWMDSAEEEQAEPEPETPDWLKAEEEERPEPEAELSDWMKSADEGQVEPESEMPDWLKAEEEGQPEPETEIPGQGVISGVGAMVYTYEPESEPEIARAGPEELAEGAGWSSEEDSGEAEGKVEEPEVPEWLKSLGEESLTVEGEAPAEEVETPFLPETEEPAQAEVPSGGSEVPDWLRTALEEQEQSQAEQPEDIPEWLRSSIPEGFPEEPQPIEGDTKPIRPRAVEERIEEEPLEEIQSPVEVPEEEGEGAWDLPEGSLPEMPAEIPAEAGGFDLREEEAYLPEEVAEPETEMEEEAAAMGWLESLAAREGAQEEELLTRPDERSESIPEWLQKLAAETEPEAEGAVEQGEPGEEMEPEQPAWQPEVEASIEEAAERAPSAEESELEVESPTEEALEGAPSGEEFEPEQPGVETGEEIPAGLAEAAEPEAELPEWLRDFAEADTGLPVEEEISAVETAAPPAEPLDLNTATLAQLERILGIGYIQAQNIINYRDTHGPLKSREDLENVPGISPDVVDRLEERMSFEQPEEISAPVEEPQEVLPEVEPGGQPPALAQAWGKLVAGEVTTAVDLYGDLIRKEQHLDQVIHELREAAFLYPQEISIHQALGDAYLRANRLQEALDAYNKAEDLLQ